MRTRNRRVAAPRRRAYVKPGPGQERFNYNGPPNINFLVYDLDQAKKAVQHRAKRKDVLVNTERTKGFKARTRNLWVPHNGTESSAVVTIPRVYAMQHAMLIRDKVYEKYEDSDVSKERIKLWAWFARNRANKELWDKFRGYNTDAHESWLRIHWSMLPDGEINRGRIEANQMAYGAIKRYIICLQSYVGPPIVKGEAPVGPSELLDVGGHRKWPQEHHKHKFAARLGWAATYLDSLPEHEFVETVREAYWSERSRDLYWAGIFIEKNVFEHEETQRVARYEPYMPAEADYGHPREDPRNYYKGEYIL